MRIGLLSGGGDSPAINAAIRAVVKRGVEDGHQIFGIHNGWAGIIEDDLVELHREDVSGILYRGGTILGTSRTNPFKISDGIDRLLATTNKHDLQAVIAIGGDDTLGVAHKLASIAEPIAAVGIPQTIDNDIAGTDYAIGFDSAMSIAADAIDKLHTTAESHHRIMIVEVMGRDAGHIALEAGLAGGADIILIPEEPFDLNKVCERIKNRRARGKNFSIVVVAEGAKPFGDQQVVRSQKVDMFGHAVLGGVGEYLAAELAKCTDIETRVTILGHLQRGGSPTPFDRLVATRLGLGAVELVNRRQWDYMVGLRGNQVVFVPLAEGLNVKPVDKDLYQSTRLFY